MKHVNDPIIKTILIAGFLFVSMPLKAQEGQVLNSSRPRNNININLLGDGSPISLNYERLLSFHPSYFLTGKIGAGYNEEFKFCLFGPCSTPAEKYLTIPHHFTGNLGTRSLFFEVGLGGTYIIGDGGSKYVVYPIVGFRVQPRKMQKMNFRLFGCFALGSPIGIVEVGER